MHRCDGLSFREIVLLFQIKNELTLDQKHFAIKKKTRPCFVQC